METFSHNKNVSTIKTDLLGTGIDQNFASLLASTLISSTADNNQGSSAGSCHTDRDNIRHSKPIRLVSMEDIICHEAEETVITIFLQFALDDTEDAHAEDIRTTHCNHIHIGTFITENKEPLALCADSGAPKSVFWQKSNETYT